MWAGCVKGKGAAEELLDEEGAVLGGAEVGLEADDTALEEEEANNRSRGQRPRRCISEVHPILNEPVQYIKASLINPAFGIEQRSV